MIHKFLSEHDYYTSYNNHVHHSKQNLLYTGNRKTDIWTPRSSHRFKNIAAISHHYHNLIAHNRRIH